MAGASPQTLPHAATSQLEFYCAEIWGGNRAFDGPISLPGVRGWVYSQPCAGGRGGDIHYVSLCNSGLISRMCLADVAGHGETVAMVSGEIHELLRRYMNSMDQRRVLVDLNRRLVRTDLGELTTAATVTYFPPSRFVSVSYAGHPPAWLYRRREDRWLRLPPGRSDPMERLSDLPLAVDPRTVFSRRGERVRPGDRIVLVTDGVLETPSPAGDLFGDARLNDVLERHTSADNEALAGAILGALRTHVGGAALSHDDVTFMILEFVPGPRGFGILHALKRMILGRPRSAHT